jgi:hypothetical protein
MELFGIAISVLTGILTYLAWRNGRWMKESHQDTMAVLDMIEKGHTEARKEMAETLKYIAQLIVSEGEKTRQIIKVKT